MQCGIGNCVNAQVKIISMNAMNVYGGTKGHIQERVCEHMCVRACMYAEGKKRNDGEYEYFRDKTPRQWRSSEHSTDISAAVTNNRMHESDSNISSGHRRGAG